MTETLAHGYSSESTPSARAFKWIPAWQGFEGFQKSLHYCALDEGSLSIGRCSDGQPGKILISIHVQGTMNITLLCNLTNLCVFL